MQSERHVPYAPAAYPFRPLATVLSKLQNAFFSLSSLIKERKETSRCLFVLLYIELVVPSRLL
jgi:hypothetical protein